MIDFSASRTRSVVLGLAAQLHASFALSADPLYFSLD